MVNKFEDLLKKFCMARIDIKNFGDSTNDVIILNKELNSNTRKPSWFQNSEGKGTVIESCEGELTFNIKCWGDGKFRIWLRGMDVRDKNNVRFPIYIDYVVLEINGDSIIKDHKLTWHDKPFMFEKDVNDGEILSIHIEWMPFNNLSEYDQETHINHEINSLKAKLHEREEQMMAVPNLAGTTLGREIFDGRLIYRNWVGIMPLGVNTLLDEVKFPCEQFWFSRFLKHRFPDEDFKINLFGVFQTHDNITYPMKGKKVFYSAECLTYRFLEMKQNYDKYALDYVDFAMGYDLIDNPRYLRFPYWFIWNVSPTFTDEQIENLVIEWNSSSYDKSCNVAAISSHDSWGCRSMIAKDIEPFVNIDYAGKWRHNTSKLHGEFKDNKNEFLKQYKFNLCAENLIDDAYVTEKIFDSFKNDCIPLYAGGGNYLEPEVINESAVLRWFDDGSINPDLLVCSKDDYQYRFTYVADDNRNQDTLELFNNICNDEKTYKEFKDQDRVLDSSAKFIINKFRELEKHFERLIYG